ncbi:unnamed protein product, partial [Ectocarpus sp. 13 AM-2016]
SCAREERPLPNEVVLEGEHRRQHEGIILVGADVVLFLAALVREVLSPKPEARAHAPPPANAAVDVARRAAALVAPAVPAAAISARRGLRPARPPGARGRRGGHSLRWGRAPGNPYPPRRRRFSRGPQ